jgi:hypothetical protein
MMQSGPPLLVQAPSSLITFGWSTSWRSCYESVSAVAGHPEQRIEGSNPAGV